MCASTAWCRRPLARGTYSSRFLTAFQRYDETMAARVRRAAARGAVLRYVGTLERGRARAGLKEFPRSIRSLGARAATTSSRSPPSATRARRWSSRAPAPAPTSPRWASFRTSSSCCTTCRSRKRIRTSFAASDEMPRVSLQSTSKMASCRSVPEKGAVPFVLGYASAQA